MSVFGEILLSIGWLIILGMLWGLFIAGTSLAWYMGKLIFEIRVAKSVFKWFISNTNLVIKGWGIENPNEVSKNETQRNKKRKG